MSGSNIFNNDTQGALADVIRVAGKIMRGERDDETEAARTEEEHPIVKAAEEAEDVQEAKKKKGDPDGTNKHGNDEVGEEDDDVDNDGDSDDSDEYLKKRRKAISKSKANEAFDGPKVMKPVKGKYSGKRKDVKSYGMPKTQKEAADLDKENVDKAITHDCASHVRHEEWGMGQCVPEMHTIVEDEENPGFGYVTHYDVMFEHGVEQNVSVEDLEIIAERSHGHKRRGSKM